MKLMKKGQITAKLLGLKSKMVSIEIECISLLKRSSDEKGTVKSSRWDEWAQRAKIAPKMLLQTFRSPLFSQQKQSFWLLSPSNMVQIHHHRPGIRENNLDNREKKS